MNAEQELQLQDDAWRAAIESTRHYTHTEMGNIPGAQFVKGPLLSFCCDALSAGAIWRVKGIRSGVCSKCHSETATFREVIK
jgi:hypothetical protein